MAKDGTNRGGARAGAGRLTFFLPFFTVHIMVLRNPWS